MVKAQLKDDLILPCENWEVSDSFVGEVDILGRKISLSGIEATSNEGIAVVGSAASISKSPFDRSFYELIERITIIEGLKKGPHSIFPLRDLKGNLIREVDGEKTFGVDSFTKNDSYQLSKSNGIALHDSWEDACYSAGAELVERHHILASWFGQTNVEKLDFKPDRDLSFLESHYNIDCYKLGESKVTTFSESMVTAMVYLKPKAEYSDKIPCVYSFSCKSDLADALTGATKEILQRIGFLWNEDLPNNPIEMMPNAHFHGDFYLVKENQKYLDMWLANSFFKGDSSFAEREIRLEFIDISDSTVSEYKVAKAISKDTIDLYFGYYDKGPYAEGKKEQRVHPIP